MLKNIWHTDAREIRVSGARVVKETNLLRNGNHFCVIKDLLAQYWGLVAFYETHRPLTSKERSERRKETMQRYYARHRDEIRARQQSYYQERKKASTVKK